MEGKLPFDPWRMLDALLRKWHRLLLASAGLALLGFLGAYSTAHYRLTVKLIRNHPPASLRTGPEGQNFDARDLSSQAIVNLLQSPAWLRRAVSRAGVSVSQDQLALNSEVSAVPGTDLILVRVQDKDAAQAVRLVNAYAEEAVRSLRELQSKEADEMSGLLQEKLASVDRQLEEVNRDLTRWHSASNVINLSRETPAQLEQGAELEHKSEAMQRELATVELQLQSISQAIGRQSPALVAVKDALGKALQRYTEEHPKVKELRAAMASLESQITQPEVLADLEVTVGGNPLANSLFLQVIELRTRKISLDQQLKQIADLKSRWLQELQKLPQQRLEYAKAVSQSDSLTRLRSHLANRQQEIQLLADNALGSYRILELGSLDDLSRTPKIQAGIVWGFRMGLLGLLIGGLWIVFLELSDGRIRTHADLKRVTRLPLLADLGDLAELTELEQDRWAFRTLTIIKGQLNMANTQTLVCGFISSSHGEGRSTWVRLLAKAADKQGYQVLALAGSHPNAKVSWSPDRSDSNNVEGLNKNPLTASIEADDESVSPAEQLTLPLLISDRTSNSECRQQWQAALQRWNSRPNLAVFVELPPASEAEAVLISDHQWPLIWVCGQDMARADETRTQLETLRHTQCRLVGAVFNRATVPRWRRHFNRLVGAALLISFLGGNHLAAQEIKPEAANPTGQTNTAVALPADPAALFDPARTNVPGTVSVNLPPELADWQKRLTLGPGDVLNISLYDDQTESARSLFIGPDGRLNYLQARDVEASGLTIDELRTKLEEILTKFYLSPRLIILPEAYRSKKYIILGNVNQKGVFLLDRPTSIIEAVARAKGFETSYLQRNALVTADLSRSFLVRQDEVDTFKQIPVDFEALFLRGDLGQNIGLVPGDYLYFPPLDVPEVYILGDVRSPGLAPYSPDLTVLRAVITRGGFTPQAYRKKILVIRGSFSHPQTFVVDASGVLSAKNPDFLLKARDIVYVPRKPWAYAQELLEAAVMEYMRAMVVTWTGQNIGPFTKKPFVPNIK